MSSLRDRIVEAGRPHRELTAKAESWLIEQGYGPDLRVVLDNGRQVHLADLLVEYDAKKNFSQV